MSTRSRAGNYESILFILRNYWSHAVFGCDESIRGALTALRCRCPCEEIDDYMRDTFLFAGRNWTHSESAVFQE